MNTPLPGKPLVWSPKGVTDTLDSSTSIRGAMSVLSDLIPDPTTRDLWQCRPAATSLVVLPGGTGDPAFTGQITAVIIVGTYIFGMGNTRDGTDAPWGFNLATNTYVGVTGSSSANRPASQPVTGPWNPPNMVLVGTKIIVQHPGFNTTNGYFGVIDISAPAAPTWTSTNTSPTALLVPPRWVVNFNGRCFYLVNPPGQQPAIYMSDIAGTVVNPNYPTTITNADQILTFGDNNILTCAYGLPLSNQLGGIIQSLIVFKGVQNMYQVTGDYSLKNISINTLNVATGTNSPRSVASSSKGLFFIAPDGLRLIDFNATVSDPIGINGDGINIPFQYSNVPSRVNAAFGSGIYRVQVQNASAGGVPQEQWWFDVTRGLWSGPHSIATDLMVPYNNTFICSLQGVAATLFQSDVVQSGTTTFTENGRALSYMFKTAFLPDYEGMCTFQATEATLLSSIGGTTGILVETSDTNGMLIDTVNLPSDVAGSVWGTMVWGHDRWGSGLSGLQTRRVSWHFPQVFNRIQFSASGPSVLGTRLGRLFMRYRPLGYLLQDMRAS